MVKPTSSFGLPRRWGFVGVLAMATLAVALGTACQPILADPHAHNESTAGDGWDITIGTGGCILNPRVPVIGSIGAGGPENTLLSQQVSGDAMPAGAGQWFEDAGHCGNEIWAPSTIFYGGQWIMHYTARKPGGQRCIGRALASSVRGPYSPVSEWACPGGGRWAIDPFSFVGHDGQLYVAYRDDAAVSGVCNTAISIVRTNAVGEAIWSTRRTALRSDQVGWNINGMPTGGCPSGVRVVENPSVQRGSGSQHYLFFSTGNFASAQYATGIASCGTNPLGPAGGCILQPLHNRPYFAFSGSGLNPLLTLPGDHPGPGGMASYLSCCTSSWPFVEPRVVWHWYHPPDGQRRSRNAALVLTPYGWAVPQA